MSSTASQLHQMMTSRYQQTQVLQEYRAGFEDHIKGLLGTIDADIEGYKDADQQRDLSIKYTWGHNHDFGEFRLRGAMGDRHIQILAEFIDKYHLPRTSQAKKSSMSAPEPAVPVCYFARWVLK